MDLLCLSGVEGAGSGRDSPLFDEFSDGEEFELPGRKRRHSKSKVKGQPLSTTSFWELHLLLVWHS